MDFDLRLLFLSALICFHAEAALQSALRERSRDKEQTSIDVAQNVCPNMEHELNTPSVCSAELLRPIDELAKKPNDGSHLAQVLQHIGPSCRPRGRLTDALDELENALAVARTSKHVADGQTANVLHVLGNVHLEMGNISKALKLYDEAGQMDRVFPQLLINMGEAYSRRGLLHIAAEHVQKALEKLEQNNVDAARAYSLDAFIRYSRGDAAGSLEKCEEALRIQAKALHPGHPDLVLTMMRKARAQRDLGSLDDALQTMEAVELTLHGLTFDELELSRVLTQKADFFRELGRLGDAEEAVKKVSVIQASVFGKQAVPEVASALNIYGGIFQDQGKFAEAEIQYQRALKKNLESVGKWHPETAAIHNSLGTLFQDVGKLEKAYEHFEECLEIQLKTLGEVNPEVASTYNNIATTLFQKGQPKEAAKLLEQALSLLDAAQVPKDSPDRMAYAENLQYLQSL
mmetsp:Transcript_102470/g.192779  ORF Transcript_102470/g.192779 Transcript_102470/m.192779 type:complete len:460 (+) Transcript_102470:171-1550(+)